MKWLRRLLRRPPKLSSTNLAAIATYQGLQAPPPTLPLHATRIVVVDVESSGLNPFRDRLLSIGAVVVRGGVIRPGEALEVVLKQETPSDRRNILVHGIDGTTQLGGQDPREALLAFLAYTGKAPLVGYHVDFDRVMIGRATKLNLGIKPENDWLDLARVLRGLFPELAERGSGLDHWLGAFSIENSARHNAVADAFATAQLLQITIAQAVSKGIESYAELRRIEQDQAWLERTSTRRG